MIFPLKNHRRHDNLSNTKRARCRQIQQRSWTEKRSRHWVSDKEMLTICQRGRWEWRGHGLEPSSPMINVLLTLLKLHCIYLYLSTGLTNSPIHMGHFPIFVSTSVRLLSHDWWQTNLSSSALQITGWQLNLVFGDTRKQFTQPTRLVNVS